MGEGERLSGRGHSELTTHHSLPPSPQERPLTATYRLQLNSGFTLHDARERVPYLHELGVSHLYCSPVLAARAGSTHGYDVADPTQVNPELGGDAAFVALAERAHAHGMGLVLDIVPNHMGIGADNPYWDDLLAHGPASRYARWFDVQWRAETRRLANKVQLPVLGESLDAVLERGELSLEVTGHAARVRYFDHHFPIDPATYPPEVELALRDPSALPAVKEWSEGEEGRERMRALLDRQHYVLDFWRNASRDINYRRFFDVNELIALKVEDEEVFQATHKTTLQFVADGLVDGLRIDHIDGLLEPRRYLERLRAAVDARRPSSSGGPRFPIVVEKILAPGETLPADWPVDGTTGYEFMTTLEDVFIDPAGYGQLEARYRGGSSGPDFHTVAYASKRAVLRNALNADVRRIAPMLATLARQARWPARSIAAYAGAIVELVAALPVYRTYMDGERPEAEGSDRTMLERAFADARERGIADAEGLTALERALLGAWRGASPDVAGTRLAFVLRLQQLTGPAAAKGVEDTALYVYAPLASRNEVGGDPGVPVDGAVDRLHALLSARERTPRALNATNTHDTKRSADVRSRLDALSEHPVSWERRLRLWRRRHRPLRRIVRGRLTPMRTTDHFIYQALVGIWPIGTGTVHEDAAAVGELRERLTAYIQKAVREAKVRTSWTDPDTEYEDALAEFIAALLDRESPARYLRDVAPLVAEVGATGLWNALARLVVHLTAPGVPDVYRGDELWFQALVDPDNRRPVDWQRRATLLDEVRQACEAGREGVPSLGALRGWRDAAEDGRLKLYLTNRLLRLRRDTGAAFDAGSYQPLAAEGTHASRVVAFRRGEGAAARITLVARLGGRLGSGAPVGARWGDTGLRTNLETAAEWRCLLSGVEVPVRDGAISVAAALAELPVALLAPAKVL
jgi:(1->4)-alpha-D-glucan 1-alpha-D-glucosylmutase